MKKKKNPTGNEGSETNRSLGSTKRLLELKSRKDGRKR